MSKEEIKYEINTILDQLSDKALEDLLAFLTQLNNLHEPEISHTDPVRTVPEDKKTY